MLKSEARRRRSGCYIWYSDEGTGRGRSPPRPHWHVPLAVAANPSTASVPIVLYNDPLLCGLIVSVKGLRIFLRQSTVIGVPFPHQVVLIRRTLEDTNSLQHLHEAEDCQPLNPAAGAGQMPLMSVAERLRPLTFYPSRPWPSVALHNLSRRVSSSQPPSFRASSPSAAVKFFSRVFLHSERAEMWDIRADIRAAASDDNLSPATPYSSRHVWAWQKTWCEISICY